MKKVLLLIKGLGRGGAEQLLVNAAPYGSDDYAYSVAYLLPWKDALVPNLRDADVPVHCLDGARGLAWTRRLRDLVVEGGFDIVHTHSPYPAACARIALAGTGVKVVHTEHNLWERYHPATYWANMLTFARNDHVFAVSDHVRTSIRYPEALGRRSMPPLETLYHGPDPVAVKGWTTDDSVRRELGLGTDDLVVGTVANFKQHKGHEHLLDAAVIVRERIPNARFVLVGQGPLEEPMKQRARELGLGDAVVFAGFREDVPRVVAALDLFVLSSMYEGLSIALVEAMALGKPAVVTSVGGLTEVIRHGTEGYVVPPGDPRALAQSISEFLEAPELRAKAGAAAALRAAKFDIRNAVARMEAVYAELAA